MSSLVKEIQTKSQEPFILYISGLTKIKISIQPRVKDVKRNQRLSYADGMKLVLFLKIEQQLE